MNRQFFAQIDADNIVTNVHCVMKDFLEANPERYSGRWVETFFDTEGKLYAGLGFIYVEEDENFIFPPEPVEP